MGLVERARIDDRDLFVPDDVAHGPPEGERSRIVAEEPAHAWAHLFDLPGGKIERPIEPNVLAGHSSATSGGAAALHGTLS